MSVEHTPTTAQIRDQFAAYEDPTMRDGSTYEANVELFDRWLAAHDAEVAAEACKDAEAEVNRLTELRLRELRHDIDERETA